LDSERVIIFTEPNRGDALMKYLQSNIFYQDKITLTDWRPIYHQFALYGTQVDAFIAGFNSRSQSTTWGDYQALESSIANAPIYAFRQKPLMGSSWIIITPTESAMIVWKTLTDLGKPMGIIPSGGIVYNALRIASGRVGAGRELTTDYIPLELGLWDEVSFSKGCYTGQEILARMESRNKLARVLMRLNLSQFAEANTPLFYDGKHIGEITSSVIAPDGTLHAMGVVKTNVADVGLVIKIGSPDGASATLIDYLGVQPRIS